MNTITNAENVRQSYLSFRVGDELFAISVANIVEILPIDKITRIPHAPDYISGVTNLRGSVIPVTNMRIKFGMQAVEKTQDACIVVLNLSINGQNIIIGALVDSVYEVFELEPSALLPPPSIGNRYRTELILGIARVAEELILVLNIDKVFSAEELTAAGEATKNGE